MTETHIGTTVNSRAIIDRADLDFYRRDYAVGGSGFIAVHEKLQPKPIQLPDAVDEVLFFRINDRVSLACYY